MSYIIKIILHKIQHWLKSLRENQIKLVSPCNVIWRQGIAQRPSLFSGVIVLEGDVISDLDAFSPLAARVKNVAVKMGWPLCLYFLLFHAYNCLMLNTCFRNIF